MSKTRPRAQRTKESDPPPREELLHRAVLESALDCIITMDAGGIVREFNPAAERTFGFTRAEAIGAKLADLIIPPRMRERHWQGLARYLKTGEGPLIGKRVEIEGLRKDGSEILVELAISAFRIEGAPMFTAYLRDITERKRDERASRHLAAIVESSDDAIISTDLDGTILTWNRGAKRLFGYTAAEVINKPLAILIPPERQNEERRILERIRRGESVELFDTIRRRKDGTTFNISLSVSPIKDAQGQILGASKIGRNTTERVRAERRRLAQYAVSSLLAGSWTLDEATQSVLQTIASIGDWVFGALWIYDESLGKLRCRGFWHSGPEKLQRFGEHSQQVEFDMGIGLPGRVWQSNKPVWIHDVVVDSNFPRAPAAKEADLHGAFGFPLFAKGEVNGMIELFSYQYVDPDPDLLQLVTALGSQIGLFIERRRMEEELRRAKDAAEAANAAKDRSLAVLSHELRTPLNPVLLWAADMVDRPGLAPEITDGLRMIARNVELEARLIDDLLDITRIASGKLQLQLRAADAHELLRQAIDIVANDIRARALNLAITLEADSHLLHVDASRVQQVFWNILRNACKFTPEKGAIHVRSRNPNGHALRIEISDTGLGIDSRLLDRIFDPFEQATSHREGLGLGLSISKAIVEMHGGKISAHSEGLGKGATFAIDLPLPAVRAST